MDLIIPRSRRRRLQMSQVVPQLVVEKRYGDVYLAAYRPLFFCYNYRRLDATIVPARNDNYVAIESSYRPFLSVKRPTFQSLDFVQ